MKKVVFCPQADFPRYKMSTKSSTFWTNTKVPWHDMNYIFYHLYMISLNTNGLFVDHDEDLWTFIWITQLRPCVGGLRPPTSPADLTYPSIKRYTHGNSKGMKGRHPAYNILCGSCSYYFFSVSIGINSRRRIVGTEWPKDSRDWLRIVGTEWPKDSRDRLQIVGTEWPKDSRDWLRIVGQKLLSRTVLIIYADRRKGSHHDIVRWC